MFESELEGGEFSFQSDFAFRRYSETRLFLGGGPFFRKIARSDVLTSSLSLRLCLSARVEQVRSHHYDFHEILYLHIFF